MRSVLFHVSKFEKKSWFECTAAKAADTTKNLELAKFISGSFLHCCKRSARPARYFLMSLELMFDITNKNNDFYGATHQDHNILRYSSKDSGLLLLRAIIAFLMNDRS